MKAEEKRREKRIINLREKRKASYKEIAAAMGITSVRARQMYEGYYGRKLIEYMERLQKTVEREEWEVIWDYYITWMKGTNKKRCESIEQNHPELWVIKKASP